MRPTNRTSAPGSREPWTPLEAEHAHATASGCTGLSFSFVDKEEDLLWNREEEDDEAAAARAAAEDIWSLSEDFVGEESIDLDSLLATTTTEEEDVQGIDEVTALFADNSEETLVLPNSFGEVVSPREAAAAVYQELQRMNERVKTTVPAPSLPPILPIPTLRTFKGILNQHARGGPLVPFSVGASIGATSVGLSFVTPVEELSVEKSSVEEPSATTHAHHQQLSEQPSKVKRHSKKCKKANKKSNRWTEEETRCLTEGVDLYGVGQWLKIKKHFHVQLQLRSNVDLKDRYRNVRGKRQAFKRHRIPTADPHCKRMKQEEPFVLSPSLAAAM